MDTIQLLNTIFTGFTVVIGIVAVSAAYTIGLKQNEINQNISEVNTKTIILRSDSIYNWDDLKSGWNIPQNNSSNKRPIIFRVNQNIALDLKGYVVLNNKKYILNFGQVNYTGTLQNPETVIPPRDFFEKLPWIDKDTIIGAIFDKNKSDPVEQENNIYITYKDVLGNAYYTKEDSKFQQISNKLNK